MRTSIRLATLTMCFLLAAAQAHAQTWSVQINNGNRFRVLAQFGNAAVLDQETGLVWERTPSATQHQWQDEQLATAHIVCATKSVGNRYGWRLPTIQELASLGDTVNTEPNLPTGHPFILDINQRIGTFWSATTAATVPINSPNHAWFLNFSPDPGSLVLYAINNSDKTADRFVWCVRGGSGTDSQ